MRDAELIAALAQPEALVDITSRLGIPFIFKASYDKANRTSNASYRGPGISEGLRVLASIKARFGVPIVTDIHETHEAAVAAEVADVLQIPAFLSRQTDLLVAAAQTGKPINVKKGQFLAPWDMKNVVQKLVQSGCRDVLVCERGVSFGYNTLVSDMRALPELAATGAPVVFDATHSVQQPGGQGSTSGGQRQYVPILARAAAAVGIAAVFIETHENPDKAPSDGPNMVPLSQLEELMRQIMAVDKLAKSFNA